MRTKTRTAREPAAEARAGIPAHGLILRTLRAPTCGTEGQVPDQKSFDNKE